jgi:hypothetical protein
MKSWDFITAKSADRTHVREHFERVILPSVTIWAFNLSPSTVLWPFLFKKMLNGHKVHLRFF